MHLWALMGSKNAFVGVCGNKVYKEMILTQRQISIFSAGSFWGVLAASDAAQLVYS